MARINPQTPLSQLINTRMAELGINRVELMKRLGYANPAKGLRRFDEFMATGRFTTHLLKGLPDVLVLDTVDVEAAAAPTRQQIADAEETDARERFRPHIVVTTKGGVRVPFFIQAFAWGEKVLGLPADFDDMTSTQQVRKTGRIVRRHFHDNGGELGMVWGTIIGYRLQRTFDHAVLLNTDGTIREGFSRDPEPPTPELRIGGKRIPVGMFTTG